MRTLAVTAALVAAVAAGLVFIPERYSGGRAYAAAAEQLRSSRSLEYTLVFNAEPYVAMDFSFLAPRYERFRCTWGIEVRADHETGKQIVLMHAARTYLIEEGKHVNHPAGSEDLVEQLRSLPQHADEALGEQRAGEIKLIGYRLRKPPNGGIPGLTALDLWIDARTRQAHHVDITVQEQGKPADTDVADIADDPALHAEIQKAIDDANKAVSKAEAIRKFTILPIDWTEEGGQLTPSLKLKRTAVMAECAAEVDALYAGGPRD